MTVTMPSIGDVAREVARRLRAGERDAATIESAAIALDGLADLYEAKSARYEELFDRIMGRR